ncbi:hypothetical protein DFJ73DRAFT_263323 [Zopfochytrium polystomum]|nr:hypothetical protein DFJ73DRAFT_263323 [Zopfochytrium polystomum]
MLQDSALPMQAQPKPCTKMARSTKQLPPIVGRRSVPSKSSTDRNLRQSILCATAIVFAYTISVAAAGPSITAFSSGSVQAINRRSAGFIQSVDDTPDFSLLAKGPSALSDPVIVSQLSKFASFLSTSEIEDVEALDEEFEGDEKPTKAHTKKGAIETFKHGQDRLPSAKYSKFKSLLASFRGEENDEETISVTSHSRNSKFRSSKNKLAEDRDEWAVDASTGVSSAGSSDRDAVESGELIIAHSPGTVPKVPTELPFEDEGDVFDPAKPAKRKGAGKKKKNKKAKGLKSVRRR